MTLKEYAEDTQLVYRLSVEVGGEDTITIEAYGEDDLLEQLRKVDNAIKLKLIEQYEDLPENQESEES